MRRMLLAIGWVMLVGSAACGADEKVTRFELDNGLRVILRPVSGSADVALLVLFDVGEDHDPEGQSGLAHLVEHCYVTAAAGPAPARPFPEIVSRYGRGWNAQTGRRYTVIAFVFPPDRLEEELADAAARMGDLKVTKDDLAREKPRLLEELGNMFENFPGLVAMNRARERVAPSADGARKGGVPAQVEALTTDDVGAYHARFYKPRNARLVLAGAVDVEAARAAIERLFGKIPSGEALPAPRPPAAARPGAVETRVLVGAPPGQPGQVALAFAPPAPGHAHYAPFLVLVQRLFAAKFRGQLPQHVQPLYAVLEAPEVLYLSAPVTAGTSPEKVAADLRAHLDALLEGPVGLADRTLARQQLALFLDTVPLPDPMLQGGAYAVALGLARREQLGIDGPALGEALLAVEDDAFRKMAEMVFGEGRGAAVAAVPDAGR